ncbi:AAA family ATPase [Lapillicoccus sp.]|uniref:AAA family ATPase n=1 Tax=Lapillicoccus sp. TaxID=1909287 RepID=UPI0025E3765D|nr:AAA family ATPase [Lapillicoccus sp.]
MSTATDETSGPTQRPETPFMITKQHRRFVEFADTVRRNRYIGACYGAPGIGKTLSAKTYASSDDWEWWNAARHTRGAPVPESLLVSRTVLFTPHVITTPRQLEREIILRCSRLSHDIQRHLRPDWDPEFSWDMRDSPHTELLIVDEAERLKTQGLEQLRDFFDRTQIGVILIGMPGFEKQLARYPQLYSRIGFAHQYRPLDASDLMPVLASYWRAMGLEFDPVTPNTNVAITTIVRITTGNFRLIERLMGQVSRILDINHLSEVTAEVIEAARETLVIGT